MQIRKEDIRRFEIFLRDKDKKSLPKILEEITYLSWHKKALPLYYFKYLYKNEVTNIADYISTKEAARIHQDPALHKPELTSIINNKLAFALFCRQHGIPTPELFGYHFSSKYYLGHTVSEIRSLEDLVTYFGSIFRNSSVDRIFIKPMSDYGGNGCFILRKEAFPDQLVQREKVLLQGRHIFQQVVTQHKKIESVNSHCLNTLRIVSYLTDKDNLEFISSFIRFGVDGSPVDNAAAGGITVGVDPEKGTLMKTGRKKMCYGGFAYTHHPNSRVEFDGFEIPYFKKALDLISATAKIIPDRLIGWDVAITPGEPLIIEANDTPDIFVSDVAQSGLLKNPVVRQLISKY